MGGTQKGGVVDTGVEERLLLNEWRLTCMGVCVSEVVCVDGWMMDD